MGTPSSRPRAITPAPARRRSGPEGRSRPPRRSSPRSVTRRRACTSGASSRAGSSTGKRNRRPSPPAPKNSALVNEDAGLAPELLGPALDLGVEPELADDLADLLADVVEGRHGREAALLRGVPKGGVVGGTNIHFRQPQARREALFHEAVEREPAAHPRGQFLARRPGRREGGRSRNAAVLREPLLEGSDARLDVLGLRVESGRPPELLLAQQVDDALVENPVAVGGVGFPALPLEVPHGQELPNLALEDYRPPHARRDAVHEPARPRRRRPRRTRRWNRSEQERDE